MFTKDLSVCLQCLILNHKFQIALFVVLRMIRIKEIYLPGIADDPSTRITMVIIQGPIIPKSINFRILSIWNLKPFCIEIVGYSRTYQFNSSPLSSGEMRWTNKSQNSCLGPGRLTRNDHPISNFGDAADRRDTCG